MKLTNVPAAAPEPTNYLCKTCGAESPVGVGYFGSPDAPHPAAGCPGPHQESESAA